MRPPFTEFHDPEVLRAILRDMEDRRGESTGQLKRVEGQLARRNQQIATQTQVIAQKDEALAEQAQAIAQKDEAFLKQADELRLEREKRLAVESANRLAQQEIDALKYWIFGRKSERVFCPEGLIIPGLFPDAEEAVKWRAAKALST